MMDVVVALDLSGEGAISDYKKQLQGLIWNERGHSRNLAGFSSSPTASSPPSTSTKPASWPPATNAPASAKPPANASPTAPKAPDPGPARAASG